MGVRRKRTKHADVEEGVEQVQGVAANNPIPENAGDDGVTEPAYSLEEGKLFKRLGDKKITPPRILDWDLLSSLGVKNRVLKMLKNLGMDKYAMMEVHGIIPLGIEFLSTFDVAEDSKSFTCRLMGTPIRVTASVMKTIFGFPSKGYHRAPPDFNPKRAWYELTGFHNWESGGLPNGFLRDPAVGILHKFLSYCVSGNDQANKVNTVECYLLFCAVKNVKVCPTSFIFDSIQTIQRRSRCKAALLNIATSIAIHFNVISSDGRTPPQHERLNSKKIDLCELRGSPFAISATELVPQERRHAVIKYMNAIAASEAGGVGSSRMNTRDVRRDNEDEDEDEGNGEDDESDSSANEFNMSGQRGGSSSLLVGTLYHEFRSFKNEWSTRFDQFRAHIDARFDTQGMRLDQAQAKLVEYNNLLDAQNQLIAAQNNLWQTQNEQWKVHQTSLEQQNQSLKEMQEHWNTWSVHLGESSKNQGSDP